MKAVLVVSGNDADENAVEGSAFTAWEAGELNHVSGRKGGGVGLAGR